MDSSLPGSSIHGILQARILESVPIPFSTGSSRPRDRIPVSCIAGRFFTVWATNHFGGKQAAQMVNNQVTPGEDNDQQP